MKILIRETHLDMIAESAADLRELRKAWKLGHLHFVCKGLGPMSRDGKVIKGETRLMLTPSMIDWQRPKGNAFRKAPGRRAPNRASKT